MKPHKAWSRTKSCSPDPIPHEPALLFFFDMDIPNIAQSPNKNEFMRERVWRTIGLFSLWGGATKTNKNKKDKKHQKQKRQKQKNKASEERPGPRRSWQSFVSSFFCFSSRFLWFLAILVADESFRIQNSKQLLKRNQSLWRKSGPRPRESFWFSFFFPHLCGMV